MKRLILAGLGWALISGPLFAQNNGGYVDDVYYNGSMAEQDARSSAKKQKQREQSATGDYDAYNSSAYDDYNNYQDNGDYYDESYIDYDDDSYTSRIRRFYYPMASVGYWGGIYSPFWNSPFYANPYYGWGGWYTPGFSVSVGWGGGPYWNNCWGMNAWYGYGGFSSWYMPYGSYYSGWNNGFWNGYYAGFYDGIRNNYPYGRTNVVYGPRGTRNGMLSSGAYSRSGRMQAYDRGGRMMQPQRGVGNSATPRANGINNGTPGRTTRGFQTIEGRSSGRNGEAIRVSEGNRNGAQVSPNATRDMNAGRPVIRENNINNDRNNIRIQQQQPARQDFNIRRNDQQPAIRQQNNTPAPQRYSPSPAPSRNFSSPAPSRSFSSPAPSRSFSSPAPSRSFSSPAPSRSGSFGGGSSGRMSGGRR